MVDEGPSQWDDDFNELANLGFPKGGTGGAGRILGGCEYNPELRRKHSANFYDGLSDKEYTKEEIEKALRLKREKEKSEEQEYRLKQKQIQWEKETTKSVRIRS